MVKFSIDYNQLNNQLTKKAYKLNNELKNKLEVVAFDIVKFRDNDDASNLWQVKSFDDGDYIVAFYDEDSMNAKKAEASVNPWSITINKFSDIQVFYKNDPIVKLASSDMGIPKEEVSMLPKYLPKKLTENKKLVYALLNQLSKSAKNNVLNKYPELS